VRRRCPAAPPPGGRRAPRAPLRGTAPVALWSNPRALVKPSGPPRPHGTRRVRDAPRRRALTAPLPARGADSGQRPGRTARGMRACGPTGASTAGCAAAPAPRTRAVPRPCAGARALRRRDMALKARGFAGRGSTPRTGCRTLGPLSTGSSTARVAPAPSPPARPCFLPARSRVRGAGDVRDALRETMLRARIEEAVQRKRVALHQNAWR